MKRSTKKKEVASAPAAWEQKIQVELAIYAKDSVEDRFGRTLYKAAVLPFIPRQGDWLAVGPDGDFLRVRDIYWSEKGGFSIWFEDEPSIGQFLNDGWVGEQVA